MMGKIPMVENIIRHTNHPVWLFLADFQSAIPLQTISQRASSEIRTIIPIPNPRLSQYSIVYTLYGFLQKYKISKILEYVTQVKKFHTSGVIDGEISGVSKSRIALIISIIY